MVIFGHILSQSDIDGHNLIITGGLSFECSFWVSLFPKHCFGNCGWWSICDDNDYSCGEDRDVEMMILNDFTIYEHAIRQL